MSPLDLVSAEPIVCAYAGYVLGGRKHGAVGALAGLAVGAVVKVALDPSGRLLDALRGLGTATADASTSSTSSTSTTPAGLRKGDSGAKVKDLQVMLNQAPPHAGLVVDGNFGTNTEKALRKYQESHRLTVNGIADAATMAVLVPDAAANATTYTSDVDDDTAANAGIPPKYR